MSGGHLFVCTVIALLYAGSEVGDSIPDDSPLAYIVIITLVVVSFLSLLAVRR